MCVGIGSFSDPYEAQGLAHFLGYFSQFFAFELIIRKELSKEYIGFDMITNYKIDSLLFWTFNLFR